MDVCHCSHFNSFATGVKSWREYFERNPVAPLAWDRQTGSADADSSPFCLNVKTVEGLVPKVNDRNCPFGDDMSKVPNMSIHVPGPDLASISPMLD